MPTFDTRWLAWRRKCFDQKEGLKIKQTILILQPSFSMAKKKPKQSTWVKWHYIPENNVYTLILDTDDDNTVMIVLNNSKESTNSVPSVLPKIFKTHNSKDILTDKIINISTEIN
jgi:hypothetical protein